MPVPFLTINTVGPDDHAVRDRRSRRRSTCRRSPPASCISPSATPSPRPAPTSPRCAPARCRDGDEYVINGQKMWTALIQLRRLRLAGLPDRPGGAPAQGPVDHHRADRRARVLLDPGAHRGRHHDQRDLLLRRPRPAANLVGEENERLAADHQPAQPRAGRADLGGAAAARPCARSGTGRGHQAGHRPAGHRRRVGAAQPGPRARQDRGAQAAQLADRGQRPTPAQGSSGPAAASATKVYGTELTIEACRLLMEVLGANAHGQRGLARRGAGRPDRADAPVGADPDLRRRHQRDPAGHDRDARRSACPTQR